MTPRPWEAEFIRLWEAGASQDAIATALGIPVGTVKSRAHALTREGKIQARPRGGAYPHLRTGAHEQESPAPVQSPVYTPVQETAQSLMQSPVQRLEERIQALEETVQSTMQSIVQSPAQRLEERVAGLEEIVQNLVQSIVQNPVQITVHDYTPPPLPRGKSTRWNMYILEPILAEITARAKAREISASRLAQELLWQALNERRSATP